jgi:hypothetical protein
VIEFLKAGGFPIFIVILCGGAGLVAAVRFLLKADERKLAIIRALTWATTFSVAAAVTADITAVMWKVPRFFADAPPGTDLPDLRLIIMEGLGEALTPAILGFTMLTLCWLLVAVGARRLNDPRD